RRHPEYLFPEWFLLDEYCLNEIIEILNDECLDALRNACQKVLYSAEFESKYARSKTICSGRNKCDKQFGLIHERKCVSVYSIGSDH
ncbi:hypothetical protein MP638_002421, partial [Amoeboaphelidium occidentale]